MMSMTSILTVQPLQTEGRPSTTIKGTGSKAATSTALIPYTAIETITKAQSSPPSLSTLSTSLLHTTFSFLHLEDMINPLRGVNRLFRTLFKPLEIPLPVRMQLPTRNLTPMIIRRLAHSLHLPLSTIGSQARTFTDFGHRPLAKYLASSQNLEVLKLVANPHQELPKNYVSDEDIRCIAANCLNLTTFECYTCFTLFDDMLHMLVQKLPKLHSLILPFCINITDAGILPFITSRAMRQLDLACCPNISDEIILALAKNASQLEMLSLRCNRTVSQTAFSLLFAQCKELREINLSQCAQINDETFIALILSAPKLRKIKISQCNLSDRAIQVLAANCLCLEELFIDKCNKLTDASLEALGQCKSLQLLDMSDNKENLTSTAVEKLKRMNAKLIVENRSSHSVV